jgi:signal transduction histidine kinase/ligand-binding sensor domain-containing protein
MNRFDKPIIRVMKCERRTGPTFGLACFLLSLFSIVPARALNPDKHISQYAHSVWRSKDGVFAGELRRVAQTTDGYLWIGTTAGLWRFDGIRFVAWVPPDGQQLLSSRVNSLLATPDGSLWIGTALGLSRWKDGYLTNFANDKGVVPAIVQAKDGTIWILKAAGGDLGPLCEVATGGMRCYGKENGIPAGVYYSLAQDTQGNLWLGGDTALVRWAPASQTVYRPRELKSNSGQGGISGLAADPEGSLWVGIPVPGPGLELAHMTAGVLSYFSSPQLHTKILAGSYIESLHLDRQRALWVGTSNHGLYRIYNDQIEHFGTAEGLSGDFIYDFFEDREGNLWVVTTKGLDCFRELSVTSFSASEGLSSEEVDAVLASKNGGIWIGGSGSLELFDHGHVRSILAGKGLPGTQVTSLFEDHVGRLWVGIDDGLTVYDEGRFRWINRRNGTRTGMIVGITEDATHGIWVESRGPSRPLIHIRDFRIDEELVAPQVPPARRVAADQAGGLWLGLLSGDLARVQDGRTETFRFEHVQDSRVEQVTVMPDGSVLGATAFGLLGRRTGKQSMLTKRNGLPCDSVYSFLTDHAGDLWLYMQCGIVEIARAEVERWWEDSSVVVHPKVLDVLDGALTELPAFQGSTITSDGRLWFASGLYLQTIDPTHLATNTLPPPVQVEAIVADRTTYPMRNGFVLPARTRDLEVDFTALSFVSPQKVGFRYKLENRDSDWRDPGTRRQAFYSDLRPGNYRFRVIASNNDGIWNNEGAELNFTVAPAWFQTGWFRALCIAIFALLAWTIYQLRVRQLRRQFAIRLDASINERTRIARELHDTLLQSFHGRMFEIQAARNLLANNPAKAMDALDSAILGADQSIAEGRNAIQDLRSQPVALGDLAESLKSTSQQLGASYYTSQSAPTFRMIVEGEPQNLSPVLQDEVHRIGCEVLRNAFRHARASQIETEIRYDVHEFRLRIRDDGMGVDPKVSVEGGITGHWGLPGIRERAKQIGAQLSLWSEAGVGTEVQLTIPAPIAYETSRDRAWFKFFRKATKP